MEDAARPFARDMDLVRAILEWVEAGAPRERRPSAEDERRFAYHCQIMHEAGLVVATVITAPSVRGGIVKAPIRAVVQSLTWKGQDALAAMRSDTVWEATKAKMKEHGLPMVLDLAVAVARGFAAQAGVPLG